MIFFDREKVHGQNVWKLEQNAKIIKVKTPEEFAVWTKINNDVLAGGYADMHPMYHYPLCEKGLLNCYITYSGNEPMADAFADGARIITVRATNLSAGKLYVKIGFKAYNYAI